MLNKSDLSFSYPESLIALEPSTNSRVLLSESGSVSEIDIEQLIDRFQSGETLLINDTKVVPRRVFALSGEEIVFISESEENIWTVLFPVRGRPLGSKYELPGGREMTLLKKGRPQTVQLSDQVDSVWFNQHGELPLPPYIQKARQLRHNQELDKEWYQTAWAAKEGSLAAPTASLHFKKNHLEQLENKGVEILKATLHVGLGTFLPIQSERLLDHVMHSEYYSVEPEVAERLRCAEKLSTLGTTATRVAETLAASDYEKLQGYTDLFIYPPYEFKSVTRLLTNFHQPETTLFALVCAFAGIDRAQESYKYAIDNEFRLFSYGDLSVWEK